MPQRIHKKSRNGCLVCKRRHIKRQPICSNCAAAERVCDYGSRSLRAASRPSLSRAGAHAALTIPGFHGLPSEASTGDSSAAPFSHQPVNMLHIELFHNLYTRIHATFDPNRSIPWLVEDMDYSFMTPYLVNGLLALSALHVSITQPDRQEYYRYHATQLQTQALSIFKEASPPVTQQTCSFANFLDLFVHFFRVYHGVRTIVNKAWHMIQDTPLGPSFNMGVDLYTFNGCLGPGCQRLLDLIYCAKLGNELTKFYRQAIESRPESLVILAYYATLFHRFRDFWLFGDSGAFIIQEVTRYLGSEWDDWMAWPNQVLNFD
ncbi:hypothetical protein BDV09DRAFT_190321 [Aspergillus tetrazonus]